jgi:leucyl aminopeptidase
MNIHLRYLSILKRICIGGVGLLLVLIAWQGQPYALARSNQSQPFHQPQPGVTTFVPNPIVAGMLAQVKQATVYTYTGQLSGEWPIVVGGATYRLATRHTDSGTPLTQATQYVYEHLQRLGLTPTYAPWSDVGDDDLTHAGRNVIGSRPGTTRAQEIVLITAHLDDCGNAACTWSGSISAPGADDNASGAAGVMVAADILSQYHFERTLRFVFFTGEEQGLLGSWAYATAARNARENIVGVYNLDMLAYDENHDGRLLLHTRLPSQPAGYAADLTLVNVFTNVVGAYGLALSPAIYPDSNDESDQWSFWANNYPALMVIEDDYDDFNPDYHSAADRLSNLNPAYQTAYIKGIIGAAAHLAGPPAFTPSARVFLPIIINRQGDR